MVRATAVVGVLPWLLACAAEAQGSGATPKALVDAGPEEKSDAPGSCTPAARCRGCDSCEALCECGGGTPDACADECASEAPPVTTATSEPPPPPPPKKDPDGTTVLTLVTDDFVVGPGEETFRCQSFGNPYGLQ